MANYGNQIKNKNPIQLHHLNKLYLLQPRFGEERFQDAIKLAYRGAALKSIDWNNFKYMVFDIPTEKGTYQERYDKMGKCFPRNPFNPQFHNSCHSFYLTLDCGPKVK